MLLNARLKSCAWLKSSGPHAGQPVGHDDHGRDVDDRPERVYPQQAAQVGAEAAWQRGLVRARRPVQQPQQGDRGQHRQDRLVLPQDAVEARRRPAARAPEQRGQPRRHEDQRLPALPAFDAAPQQGQGGPRRRRRGQRGHGGPERAGDGQHEHAGNHRPRDLLRAAGRRRLRAPAGPDVGCRFGQGATQIGDDQARSWRVAGRSGRGSTPARTASHVDQRHDGFSRHAHVVDGALRGVEVRVGPQGAELGRPASALMLQSSRFTRAPLSGHRCVVSSTVRPSEQATS